MTTAEVGITNPETSKSASATFTRNAFPERRKAHEKYNNDWIERLMIQTQLEIDRTVCC